MRILALLVAALAAVVGCNGKAPTAVKLPPPVVTVAKPVVREVSAFHDFTGRTKPVEEVAVRARVSGHLTKVDFVDGQEVQENAPLFQIDPRPYQADWDRAKGELARMQAMAARAAADLARAQKLRPSGAISQEELDQNIAQEKVAAASVKSAEAAVEQTRLNLDYTSILAPISGRTGRANITVGNLIQAGAGSDTVLTTIVRMDPMYIYFNVDEQALLESQKAARDAKEDSRPDRVKDWKIPIYFGLANEEGFPHEGVLDFIDNQVNLGTGTIELRAVCQNTDRRLVPGLFVRVRIVSGKPRPALMVSDRALGSEQGEKFLYVVNGKNEVEYRSVKTGQLQDGLRVIESGLKADEQVIINGLQRVRPGVTVDPKPGEMAPKASVSTASATDPKTLTSQATEEK